MKLMTIIRARNYWMIIKIHIKTFKMMLKPCLEENFQCQTHIGLRRIKARGKLGARR